MSVGVANITEDVLPPNGGYIVSVINRGGYIATHFDTEPRWRIVHRETRYLKEYPDTLSFSWARAKQLYRDFPPYPPSVPLLLELSPDMGGQTVWVAPDHLDIVIARLKIWSGCYGRWPVHILRADA